MVGVGWPILREKVDDFLLIDTVFLHLHRNRHSRYSRGKTLLEGPD